MIGSGLKKLAVENGMRVASGVAYGSLRGFAATLSEGSGYKQIVITTKFTDPANLAALQEQINQRNVTRDFRVQQLNFAPNGISVIFTDGPGALKKIGEFMDWFFPLLSASGAAGVDVCAECGGQLTGGSWKLIDGTAFHMHESCAQKVRRDIEEEAETRSQQDTGSYGLGLLGALLGAVLGAVVWALVLMLGYVASLVGLLIGWLSEKGYNLLRGKQGKGKVVILIIAVIFGVLMGTLAAEYLSLAVAIGDGELPGFEMADVLPIILTLLLEDAEYQGIILQNVLMGLLFAGIGVFALLHKTGKAVAKTKVVDLP